MERMRILFLTYQGDIAGSTNSISYLAKGLAARGHQVLMGCRRESLLYTLLINSGVHLIPMQFNSKLDLKNIKAIKEVVVENNIQIINAQSSKDRYTSMLAKWWYKLNVKLVYTRRQNPKGMNKVKSFFIEKGADKMVVISQGLKDIFSKAGVSDHFMQVIHNGIPKERYEQWSQERVDFYRNKFNISPEEKVVGSVSRMKNQDQIIKAVAQIEDPSITLLFAGIIEQDLKEEIERTGIKNRVIFAGVIPGKDILNIYRLMDVKILASTMDGFGLALLEAMAMGVPVVGTSFGGIKDVIEDQKNGLLFDDDNINQLAMHIKHLLYDQELRCQLIEGGYKTAFEKFTMEETIKGYESFFNQLLKKQ